MIDRVEIRNFQSLASVDLDLDRFTVIVGPSSSGKTALMRAFKAIASNISGTSAITRGAKAAAITVHTGTHQITLEYGRPNAKAGSAWFYRMVTPDGEERYTSLNRAVPDDITAALRIQPVPTNGSSINFAGQFDAPFLLRDSGASVARVLGELTNVDRIFEAVREANRRKAALSSTQRTRQADLVDLKQRATAFAGLPAKLRACDEAEETAERAARLSDRVGRLKAATDTLEVAEGVLARSSVLPEVPDAAAITDAHTRLTLFKSLMRAYTQASQAHDKAQVDADQWKSAEEGLEEQLHRALVEAGTCPTCERPM